MKKETQTKTQIESVDFQELTRLFHLACKQTQGGAPHVILQLLDGYSINDVKMIFLDARRNVEEAATISIEAVNRQFERESKGVDLPPTIQPQPLDPDS